MFPYNAMIELLETSSALLNAIEVLPDNTWIEVTAHLAPELEQMKRAIKLTEECQSAVEEFTTP